jgi:hypothetical protein
MEGYEVPTSVTTFVNGFGRIEIKFVTFFLHLRWNSPCLSYVY